MELTLVKTVHTVFGSLLALGTGLVAVRALRRRSRDQRGRGRRGAALGRRVMAPA